MYNEAVSEFAHDELRDHLAKEFRQRNYNVWTEATLPNGRRADLLVSSTIGDVYIFECKISFKHRQLQEAFGKYGAWCNYLYLVVPFVRPGDVALIEPKGFAEIAGDRVGVLELSPHQELVHRSSIYRQMHPDHVISLALKLAQH